MDADRANDPNEIAENFAERYLNEWERPNSISAIPVDPNFVSLVVDIMRDIGVGVAAGAGKDIYDKLKKLVIEHFQQRQKSQTKNQKTIYIEGPRSGVAILEFGNVRPLFHVQKGHRVVISNLTIRYSGKTANLIREESGPSFFPINVRFIRVHRRSTQPGLYQIRSPLWIGEPKENPYDQRWKGGDVITFD